MANIRKAGAPDYVDPGDTTTTIANPYMVCDYFSVYDKKTRVAQPVFLVYPRVCTIEERRTGVIKPVETISNHLATGDDFDAFFSPAAIEADKDQYNRAYSWLLQLTDENDDLVYGDEWESDEV